MTPGRIRSLILSIITVCLFISCPTPFDKDKLLTLQDLNPPVITINSPSQGSLFESSLTVSGTIIDVDSDGDSRGAEDADQYIGSASFIIKNQESNSTAITVGTDGSFFFSVPTAEYDKQITIQITAVDINDNEVEATVIVDPDTDGPNLVLTSPVDYSEYATAVILSGYVTNSLETELFTEVNTKISYALPGTDISGELTLSEENGTFSTVLDVSALEGSRTIEVTALDLNGNETTLICTITKPAEGGDISGFSVVPGNKQVTISWDDVLFAESYTLFETNFGVTMDNVTSPYMWDGLENGEIYNFTLTANIPADLGGNAYSGSISKMPLSPLTLTPRINATGYGSISLEWRDIPQVTSYTVERSLSATGPWEVRRNLSANTFTDDKVEFDTSYFYRVILPGYTEIPGKYAASKPGNFGRGQVDFVNLSHAPSSITISGNYAYLCQNANGGLNILDITDPEHIGSPIAILEGERTWGVDVSGDFIIVTIEYDGDAKLAIINSANPLNPGSPVFADLNNYARSVTVSDDYAYIAAMSNGLGIVDISDKSNPSIANFLTNFGEIQYLASNDGYLYLASGTNFYILDISSTPGSPILRDTVTLENNNGFDKINSILIKGNTAYLAGQFTEADNTLNGLALIDITDPTDAGIPVYAETPSTSYSLDVYGSYAYLTGGAPSVYIVDMSDPSIPRYAETMECSTTSPGDIAISGHYTYISDIYGGITIFNIANPTNPSTPTNIPTSGEFTNIEVLGNTVIALDYNNGLATIDITDPKQPGSPYYIYTSPNIKSCNIYSNYAFINESGVGIKILDISDINHPIELTTIQEYDRNYTFYGGSLLVTAGNKLRIYNIEIPENPSTPVSYYTGENPIDVAVADHYAYVIDEGGIACIDLVNPGNPVLLDRVNTPLKNPSNITITGNYAYLCLQTAEFAIIDISDPTSLGSPVYIPLSKPPFNIEISGNFAFISVKNDGIAIVDIRDPQNPGTPIYRDTASYGYDVAVSGSYAYVADGTAGLAVIPLLGDE